jgi:hypothetical protein
MFFPHSRFQANRLFFDQLGCLLCENASPFVVENCVRVAAGSPERYCKGGRGLESSDCYSQGGLSLVIMVHLVV